MPRTPRTPKTSGAPPGDGAPVAAPDAAADAHPDTSVADAARLEYDDDDVSPINPAVKLRLVADFMLERVARRAARGVNEQRVQINGPGVHAGMSKDEIGAMCGPGEYVCTWRRAPASKRTETGAARPKLENYKISRFALEWTGAGYNSAAAAAAGAAGGAMPPGMMPLPTTTAPGERLVPAAFTADESWFAAWQVDMANQRAELVEMHRAALTALADAARRASEESARAINMAGSMVQAMQAQGEASLQRSTTQAQQLLLMQERMQGDPAMAVVAKIGNRLADRFVPETNAKPDEIMTTLAQFRAALPGIAELTALAPELKRVMPKLRALLPGDEPAEQPAAGAPSGQTAEPSGGAPTSAEEPETVPV